MTGQPVSITAALADAWERMKKILFRPFDIGKWFVIGFTAWLAGLAGGGGGGSSSFTSDSDWGDSDHLDLDFDGVGSAVHSGFSWLLHHPLWLAAGLFGCAFLIVVILAVLWVSSRGKFMFLDNVVHDRAEVARPWKRYRRVANSHFGFQLIFIAAVLALVLGVGLVVVAAGIGSAEWDFGFPIVVAVAVAVSVALLTGLVAAYVQYFLDGFVVPLMHRYDLTVMPAWRRFGELLRRHPFALLLSGPFLLVLGLAVAVVVIAAGLMTCCVGFLFLLIPYIGTVILLPVPVTYRAFTVALLDQMDPGFFPDETAEPEALPPAEEVPASS